MISVKQAKLYCKDDISKIENYEQAINDKDNEWVCHHRLELTLDGDLAHNWRELNRLGMYWKRPYFELIFMRADEHRRLHNSTNDFKNKLLSSWRKRVNKKPTLGKTFSEFGIKFKEHYGITNSDDHKLYDREYQWYKSHNNKCRWEINNAV